MPAKGSQKANHKYVKRKWVNGRWQYYYKGSKVKQLQDQVDKYSREAALNLASGKGHTNKVNNTPVAKGEALIGPPTLSGIVGAYRTTKGLQAKKKATTAQNKLYTQARNEARAIMNDSRYQKQIAKNAANSQANKAKARTKKAKDKALKRQAIKNSIKYKIASGKIKVKRLVNAIKSVGKKKK